MINPIFSMSPAARRAICDAALARYLGRAVEAVNYWDWLPSAVEAKAELEALEATEKQIADTVTSLNWSLSEIERLSSHRPPFKGRDPRIGEVVQVPFVTAMTIVARVTKFGRDWYKLEATLISRMTLHKLVEAI